MAQQLIGLILVQLGPGLLRLVVVLIERFLLKLLQLVLGLELLLGIRFLTF